MNDQPKKKRRKGKKPPRCVLLDTRQYADLEQLQSYCLEMLGILRQMAGVLQGIGDFCRAAVPIIGELHALKAKQSAAGRKAAATRQGAGQVDAQQPRHGFEAIVLSGAPDKATSAVGGNAEVNPPSHDQTEGDEQ